jgi:glutathione peroxidase-family protein/uncharacterized membrane protein
MKTSPLQNTLRFLLGLLMVLLGTAHLSFQRQEFLAQVPRWLTNNEGIKDLIVVSSGIVEIALGLLMLFVSKHKIKIGIVLAVFFVLVFPGNIAQYMEGTNAFGLDTDTKRFIRLFFQPVLILWALWSTGAYTYLINKTREQLQTASKSFYDFEALDIKGKAIKMESFKNKTIVVVNTASKCGLTPQYEGLEKLYSKYKDQGLVVLGFPCNQFANQEAGTSEEILEFCQVNYGVSFPIFSKIEVNGENAHAIFKFLKIKLGGYFGNEIKWNFTKFVINKKGVPVKRFSPVFKPENMEAYLKKLLEY